ncbi:DUF3313 domain-containing protein [Corallincola holothuriorum]|uniref:DUF3313 domain-containing protein n=1 Tax=Corallincola holothuriorum TaxID=2282215 RepID=A0A368NMI8_9GAMM|nr:DUF3313 domain-containing protein [Corallincola holothuriorum]RCU51065.1 DUF3313 domain-containing protein [Corallincola holothuriorum]
MIRPLALTLALALIAACSSAPETEQTFSGYLHDYNKLKPDPEDASKLIWYAEDYSANNYAMIDVEPAKIWLSPKLSDKEVVPAEKQQAFAAYLVKSLKEAIPEHLRTAAAGNNTLIIKPAITGFSTGSADLAAYQYLPIGLIVVGAMEATDSRDKVPVMFLEAEAIDKDSGKVVAQVVRRLSGKDIDPDLMTDNIVEAFYPQLDAWAKELADNLQKQVENIK